MVKGDFFLVNDPTFFPSCLFLRASRFPVISTSNETNHFFLNTFVALFPCLMAKGRKAQNVTQNVRGPIRISSSGILENVSYFYVAMFVTRA